MLSKNVETLKNLNGTTAKFAKWYVRIIDPKIIRYTFMAKGEAIKAQKFQCVLVSKEPEQYMLGLVPFDFKDRNAAVAAAQRFTTDSVWELTTPAFDSRAKPEFNGCPLKAVVLLSKPTVAKPVPLTNHTELAHPAKGLYVALDIKGIMDLLKGQSHGSRGRETRTFDFSGKFLGLAPPKQVLTGGRELSVSEATFVDSGGSKIAVSVWQDAGDTLSSLPPGSGVAVIGSNAIVENDAVKVNSCPASHICTSGDQAQSLTSMDETKLATQVLTATSRSGKDVASMMESEAHPTCAAALADAVVKADPITFQINRCLLDAPLQEELLYTPDKRLFIKSCRLRDGTGGVDVDVVSNAVPALYGCADETELRTHLDARSLTSLKVRLNVRGLLRNEGGSTKRYIVKVEATSLESRVSTTALRQSLGLSTVMDDVVMPVPASRVVDSPLLGMALTRDDEKLVGAHRVLLLVRGTSDAVCDPIADDKPVQEQIFKVTSKSVLCLPSDPPVHLDVVGYCDYKKMMTYRLDKEAALVLASAVASPSSGAVSGSANSVAAEGEPTVRATFTIEHLTRVSKDEAAALLDNMPCEWKAILTSSPDSATTPAPKSANDDGYWSEERASKVRRMASEPQSPNPSAAARKPFADKSAP